MVGFRVWCAVLLLALAAAAPVLAQGFSAPAQGPLMNAPAAPPGNSLFGTPQTPPTVTQPPAFPGFGTPPSPQAAQPARPNFADELTDFGVPPQSTLQTNVGSPTPLTIPGGHVITTTEVRQAVGSDILFVDVWASAAHPSIPGAVPMPGAGNPGSFNDETQQRLWAALAQLTQRQPPTGPHPQ